jgi:hypothetical protein
MRIHPQAQGGSSTKERVGEARDLCGVHQRIEAWLLRAGNQDSDEGVAGAHESHSRGWRDQHHIGSETVQVGWSYLQHTLQIDEIKVRV